MICPRCRREHDLPQVSRAERRHLTVLFCDLVDSARLAEQLDPEDLHAAIGAYREACTKVIERYEGLVAQYLGDGVLAYFGFPHAHEDDAERAVNAGLEILEEIRGAVGEEAVGGGAPVPARIGIHSGSVVVLPPAVEGREPQAVGHTMNVASRLQCLAAPGSVLVSAETLRLVRGRFVTRDAGVQQLKGIARPVPVHEVLRPMGVESAAAPGGERARAPFVGRGRELAQLVERWHCAQTGPGQVVSIRGEPGVGKSRLVETACGRLPVGQGIVLQARCHPHHANTALFPLRGLVAQTLRFVPGEPEAARLRKLERRLDAVGLDRHEALPLLADVLALPLPEDVRPARMSPEMRRRRTMGLLRRWLEGLASRVPLVLVVEDLHWADPSTLRLLEVLVEPSLPQGMLLLLTARPGSEAPRAVQRSGVELVLEPLAPQEMEALVTGMADGRPLPRQAIRQVVERADGIPLFAEELVLGVLEQGAARDLDMATGEGLEIPSTLRESLAARLDHLGAAREVARTAAVLGREFCHAELAAVSDLDPASLRAAVERLEAAGLLSRRGVPPKATYVFRHSLVLDAAYESMLRATRRALHGRVADMLGARVPEVERRSPELLAHHLERAGRVQEAARLLDRAAKQTFSMAAYDEGLDLVRKGLALVPRIEEPVSRKTCELQLLTTLGSMQFSTRGFGADEVAVTFERARALCDELRLGVPLAVAHGLWAYQMARSDRDGVATLIPALHGFAERRDDPASVAIGRTMLAITAYFAGDPLQCLAHLEAVGTRGQTPEARRFAVEYGWDGELHRLAYETSAHFALGHFDQARSRCRDLLSLAEPGAEIYSITTALGHATYLAHELGELDTAEQLVERSMAIANEQQLPALLANTFCSRGFALVRRGFVHKGLTEIETGLTLLRAAGVVAVYGYHLLYLAQAHLEAGDVERGLAAIAEGLALCARHQARFHESELYRIEGELRIRRGEAAEAEARLCEALAIARRRGARAFELRAATSLARLLRGAGRRDEARWILEPVFGAFREGFDTTDLRVARELLDGLSH